MLVGLMIDMILLGVRRRRPSRESARPGGWINENTLFTSLARTRIGAPEDRSSASVFPASLLREIC